MMICSSLEHILSFQTSKEQERKRFTWLFKWCNNITLSLCNRCLRSNITNNVNQQSTGKLQTFSITILLQSSTDKKVIFHEHSKIQNNPRQFKDFNERKNQWKFKLKSKLKNQFFNFFLIFPLSKEIYINNKSTKSMKNQWNRNSST